MKTLCALILALVLPSAAVAAPKSVYTTFDFKKCKVLHAAVPDEEDGGSYLCKGYGGLTMYFASGDLREMMAFGKEPQNHCAATQMFSQFNSAGATIEWRVNQGKPFATIQRWTVSISGEDSEKTASWLVVSKLEAKNSCRMAIVEGAMPGANAKARELADQLSSTFTCSRDEAKRYARPETRADSGDSSVVCPKK
jgi:hypothetical protein